jgi:hypothetical protein
MTTLPRRATKTKEKKMLRAATAASVSAAFALLALRRQAVGARAAERTRGIRWCTNTTSAGDRLTALRALFGTAAGGCDIAAFVVPSSDAHQVGGVARQRRHQCVRNN